MDELRKMDKIAYVRFASVYREFSDVSQFVDTLQSLGTMPAGEGEKRSRSNGQDPAVG
jgi:transcriptional repressor NrdR